MNKLTIPANSKQWYNNFYPLFVGQSLTDNTGDNKINNYLNRHNYIYCLNAYTDRRTGAKTTPLKAAGIEQTADKIINQFESDKIIGTYTEIERYYFTRHINQIKEYSILYSLTRTVINWINKHIDKALDFKEEEIYKQIYPLKFVFYNLRKVTNESTPDYLFNNVETISAPIANMVPPELYPEFAEFLNETYDFYFSPDSDINSLHNILRERYNERIAIYKRKTTELAYRKTPIELLIAATNTKTIEPSKDSTGKEKLINTYKTQNLTVKIAITPTKQAENESKMLELINNFFTDQYRLALQEYKQKDYIFKIAIPFETIKDCIFRNKSIETPDQKKKFRAAIKQTIKNINGTDIEITVKHKKKKDQKIIFEYLISSIEYPKDEDTAIFELSSSFALYLLSRPIGYLPKKAFNLTGDAWTLAIYIHSLLTDYGHTRKFESGEEIKRSFKVLTLLENCPSISSYEMLKNLTYNEKSTGRTRDYSKEWKRYIRDKFEKTLNSLQGIIYTKYVFAEKGIMDSQQRELHPEYILKGEKLEEARSMYSTYRDLRIVFFIENLKTPNDKKAIEKYTEQISKKTKKKKQS